MWNERFAATPEAYGAAPNAWLVEHAGRIKRGGAVLCLAEGQGRNSLWLAQQGFRVTAVDFSPVALEQLQARAAQLGVEVKAVQADLTKWTPAANAFDGVALIFAHFAPEVRSRMHRAAEAALRPGGVLIVEAFSKLQRGRPSGGPSDPDLLYSAAELVVDFADLHIVTVEGTATVLDEGPLHQGDARVVRLVAVR